MSTIVLKDKSKLPRAQVILRLEQDGKPMVGVVVTAEKDGSPLFCTKSDLHGRVQLVLD
ncbi:MAG: hypothetical protein FWG82_00930 [Oscillospiraceae bacterium]|nr:hypothetical protein [Oscillospiraceae bacterium]